MKEYRDAFSKKALLEDLERIENAFKEKSELLSKKIKDCFNDQEIIISTDKIYDLRKLIDKIDVMINSIE